MSIEGTVIPIPEKGLIVQPHIKSKVGMRTITPPTWVLNLLRCRHVESLCAWIFPTTRRTLRDPDNTGARLRDAVREHRGKACTHMRSGTWWSLD